MNTESNAANLISPEKATQAAARVELTPEMKLSKLFENIYQITLDKNYAHPSNKCIFIGELDSMTEDTLLKSENLDEVKDCWQTSHQVFLRKFIILFKILIRLRESF